MKRVSVLVVAGLIGIVAALFMRSKTDSALPNAGPGTRSELGPEDSGAHAIVRSRRWSRLQSNSPTDRPPTRDSSSPEYDPVIVNDVYQVPPARVFAAELRDDEWATIREETIGAQVGRDVAEKFPRAIVEHVECRTSACQIQVRSAPEDEEALYRYIQHPVLGDAISPGLDRDTKTGEALISLTVLFSRQHRDHSAYAEWYAEVRRREIKALREFGDRSPSE